MTPIGLAPEKVEQIVLASCYLHNFLRSQAKAHLIYTPPGSLDIEDPDTHQVIPGEMETPTTITGNDTAKTTRKQ